MLGLMLRLVLEHPQVAGMIIPFVAVLMVHHLLRSEPPAELLFHHRPMDQLVVMPIATVRAFIRVLLGPLS